MHALKIMVPELIQSKPLQHRLTGFINMHWEPPGRHYFTAWERAFEAKYHKMKCLRSKKDSGNKMRRSNHVAADKEGNSS